MLAYVVCYMSGLHPCYIETWPVRKIQPAAKPGTVPLWKIRETVRSVKAKSLKQLLKEKFIKEGGTDWIT